MEVIRETKRIEKNQITINLPDEFVNKKVEITISPIVEKKEKENKKSLFLQFVKENQFKLPLDYKFVREELYDR